MKSIDRIEVWPFSEKGPCKEMEDCYGFEINPQKVIILAACDGTPGKDNSGKNASSFVVKHLIKKEHLDDIADLEGWVKLIEEINGEMYKKKIGECTLAFFQAILDEEIKIRFINIGDTRVYQLGKRTADVLTIDDRMEVYSSELSQAMGSKEINLHYGEINIPYASEEEEIAFMVCTDGFFDVIDRIDDRQVFAMYSQLKGRKKHENIVKLFKFKKAEDNATLVTVIINTKNALYCKQ